MNPNDPNANQAPYPNQPPGIPPQYYSFMAQPSVYSMQPPPTGMSFMPSMMPGMPHAYPSFGPQPVYPAGQGPLADVSAARGENGLYRAPEPEGPEPHEAKPFLRLNPAEAAKYIEYWDEACEGEETVTGAHAVAFLGRAPKVSKAQLRKVWEVADHRKEGFLDQEQFYIALRLIALAQRGAELSVAGLRNFTGIQLIPNISPPPPPPPPEPEPSLEPPSDSATNPSAPAASASASSFSWYITIQIAQKFDEFFNGLASSGGSLLDATAVVPFFVKSGLPRPTLRTIWQLSDVSKDGKLSREEFRTAMHLVTCIRNRRITLEDLPDHLDPNGPNWVRIEGEAPSMQTSATNAPQSPPMSIPPQEPDGSAQPYLSTSSLGLSLPGSSQPLSGQGTQTMASMDHMQSSQYRDAQNLSREGPDHEELWRREAQAERDERRKMLEELRLEREEMERTRREMEAMRTEMLRMRMGNSSVPADEGTETTETTEAQNKRALPPVLSDEPSIPSQPIQSKPIQKPGDSLLGGMSSGSFVTSQSRPETILRSSGLNPIQDASQKAGLASEGDAAVNIQRDDGDDSNDDHKVYSAPRADDNDDDDDDDDDDDFWGGLGPKPTLGATGTQNPTPNDAGGTTAGTTKSFGGSELDDWVF